jgi:predicted dehydrogenase
MGLTGPDFRTVAPEAARLTPSVGVLGAGNFATRVLIPALAHGGARLVSLASEGGLSAVHAGRKLGFEEATTDAERILAHPEIEAVVIATRHDSHADLVVRALDAGKHVFVEKPLAIDAAQLARIEAARQRAAAADRAALVMVGFNRRFAPLIEKSHALLRTVDAPKSFVMTVNAGSIPADHWTQSASEGGGRLIGEACHFIDLILHLAGTHIASVQTTSLGSLNAPADTATIQLTFEDGSIGSVHYFANGHRSYPKERLEVFCGERVLQLDNFRTLRGWGWPGFRKQSLWFQDKGHDRGVAAFLHAIRQRTAPPIAWNDIVETTRASFAAVESAATGERIELAANESRVLPYTNKQRLRHAA